MHYVQFKILDVNCGWIYAAIETEEEQIYIDNSHLGGLQMPGVFLKSITELLSRKEQEKWICWHGQSNSYIWHLNAIDGYLELCIYEGSSSFGFPLEGDSLMKKAEDAQMILKTDTWLHPFATSICDAFKAYAHGNLHEIWQNSQYKDVFPQTELSQLRKLLRSKI